MIELLLLLSIKFYDFLIGFYFLLFFDNFFPENSWVFSHFAARFTGCSWSLIGEYLLTSLSLNPHFTFESVSVIMGCFLKFDYFKLGVLLLAYLDALFFNENFFLLAVSIEFILFKYSKLSLWDYLIKLLALNLLLLLLLPPLLIPPVTFYNAHNFSLSFYSSYSSVYLSFISFESSSSSSKS